MRNLITLNGAFYWLELKIGPRFSRDVTGGKKLGKEKSVVTKPLHTIQSTEVMTT